MATVRTEVAAQCGILGRSGDKTPIRQHDRDADGKTSSAADAGFVRAKIVTPTM